MEQYITAGSTVWLESDVRRSHDDFNRLLRYVWTKDENGDWRMLEADLIRSGMAHVRTYDEDRYVPYFHALEREAMAAGPGRVGHAPHPAGGPDRGGPADGVGHQPGRRRGPDAVRRRRAGQRAGPGGLSGPTTSRPWWRTCTTSTRRTSTR